MSTTTPDDLGWPDVEALLLARLIPVLKDQLDPDGGHKLDGSNVTPADLEGRWFIRLEVVNGSDDGLTDTAWVDVEAFTPVRGDSVDLANAARRAIHQLAGTSWPDGQGLVDSVETATRPRWIDYRNPAIQRVAATYVVATRLQ